MLKSAHIISRVSLGVAIAVAAALLLAIFVSPSGISSTNTGSPHSEPAPDTAATLANSDKPAGKAPKKVRPGFFNTVTGEVILPDAVTQLVVISDLHGDLKAAVLTLKLLGVIEVSDSEIFILKSSPERSHPAWKYIGGPTMMVFLTGDYMDRGPHGADIIEMLLDLAAQAQKVGTNVHLLMGNHEYWQFDGRNDFNHIDEFEKFLPESKSSNGRPRPVWDPQRQLATQYKMYTPEYRFFQTGIMARAEKLFNSKSGVLRKDQVLARMISNMPLLIKVGNILISHAGVTAQLATKASTMNKKIAACVQRMKRNVWPDVVKGITAAALDSEDTSMLVNRKLIGEAAVAKEALAKHDIRLQLIGHSPMATELNGFEPTVYGDHVIVNDLAPSMWMYSTRRTRDQHAVGGLVVDVSNRDQPLVYANTKKNGIRQIWPELPKMPEQFVQ